MDVHCSRRARMKAAENKQLLRDISLHIVPVMYIFLDSYYLSAVTFFTAFVINQYLVSSVH